MSKAEFSRHLKRTRIPGRSFVNCPGAAAWKSIVIACMYPEIGLCATVNTGDCTATTKAVHIVRSSGERGRRQS
jgi:hypothetical protein